MRTNAAISLPTSADSDWHLGHSTDAVLRFGRTGAAGGNHHLPTLNRERCTEYGGGTNSNASIMRRVCYWLPGARPSDDVCLRRSSSSSSSRAGPAELRLPAGRSPLPSGGLPRRGATGKRWGDLASAARSAGIGLATRCLGASQVGPVGRCPPIPMPHSDRRLRPALADAASRARCHSKAAALRAGVGNVRSPWHGRCSRWRAANASVPWCCAPPGRSAVVARFPGR